MEPWVLVSIPCGVTLLGIGVAEWRRTRREARRDGALEERVALLSSAWNTYQADNVRRLKGLHQEIDGVREEVAVLRDTQGEHCTRLELVESRQMDQVARLEDHERRLRAGGL